MQAKTSTEYGTQIEVLQGVSLKVGVYEPEQGFGKVAIVAGTGLHGIGRRAWSGTRSVIGCIHAVRVETPVVVHGLLALIAKLWHA
jgi:hypothetical protein